MPLATALVVRNYPFCLSLWASTDERIDDETIGAKARIFGIIPVDLSLFSLIGAAAYGAFNAGGGVDGFVKFLTAA